MSRSFEFLACTTISRQLHVVLFIALLAYSKSFKKAISILSLYRNNNIITLCFKSKLRFDLGVLFPFVGFRLRFINVTRCLILKRKQYEQTIYEYNVQITQDNFFKLQSAWHMTKIHSTQLLTQSCRVRGIAVEQIKSLLFELEATLRNQPENKNKYN